MGRPHVVRVRWWLVHDHQVPLRDVLVASKGSDLLDTLEPQPGLERTNRRPRIVAHEREFPSQRLADLVSLAGLEDHEPLGLDAGTDITSVASSRPCLRTRWRMPDRRTTTSTVGRLAAVCGVRSNRENAARGGLLRTPSSGAVARALVSVSTPRPTSPRSAILKGKNPLLQPMSGAEPVVGVAGRWPPTVPWWTAPSQRVDHRLRNTASGRSPRRGCVGVPTRLHRSAGRGTTGATPPGDPV